MAKQAVRSI